MVEIRKIFDDYKYMNLTFNDYLFKYVIPFTISGISTLIIALLFSDIFGSLRYLLYFLSGMFILVGIFYPKIWANRRTKELEQNIHLFITHLGVLAETGIERTRIFELLSKKRRRIRTISRSSSTT